MIFINYKTSFLGTDFEYMHNVLLSVCSGSPASGRAVQGTQNLRLNKVL